MVFLQNDIIMVGKMIKEHNFIQNNVTIKNSYENEEG